MPAPEDVTDNHLPAISWSIGVYEPQRQIWIILILLATAPRITIGACCFKTCEAYRIITGPLYESLYRSTNAPYANHWLYILLCKLVHWLTVIEYSALIIVSVVSIDKHFGEHSLKKA